MFTLIVKDHFCSAHSIIGYEGNCAKIHGHTFKCEFYFEYNKLNDIGIAEDFKVLKSRIKKLIDILDHDFINTIIEQATAENIAKWFYENLKEDNLKKVIIWEGENAGAEYRVK